MGASLSVRSVVRGGRGGRRTALVRRGVEAIEQGEVQKVVSSRATRQLLPPEFDALLAFVARYPNLHPLLVVAEQDFGKALGMLLRPQLQQHPLAVIDEVVVRAGDYIDIGTPLFGGSVVPVTVKSLAFPS